MNNQMEFTLTDGQEFIELNKLLKITGLVSTGGEANVRITEGEVKLNGKYVIEKRKKIRVNDIIEFDGTSIKIK